MPKRLQTRDPGFETAFVAFLGEKREASDDVGAAAAAILADVRKRGDAALVELSKKFDRVDLDKLGLRVTVGRDACRPPGVHRRDAVGAGDRRQSYCRASRPPASDE